MHIINILVIKISDLKNKLLNSKQADLGNFAYILFYLNLSSVESYSKHLFAEIP